MRKFTQLLFIANLFVLTAFSQVITDCNLAPWKKITSGTAEISFVNGPGTPPRGTGSLKLNSGSSSPELDLFKFNGEPLSRLDVLRYSTYIEPNTPSNTVPILYLSYSINGINPTDVITFNPAEQSAFGGQAVTAGTWQTWNASAGRWKLNGSFTTIAALIAQYPSATFIYEGNYGIIGISQVFGTGYVDEFSISINGNGSSYNFEAGSPTSWYLDKDGDGYSTGAPVLSCTSPGPAYKSFGIIAFEDCDDGPAGGRINKGAPEICNGIDDDCDGLIDANDPSLAGETLWYLDKDGDGYSTGDPIRSCSSPGAGYKSFGVIAYEDCNDGPDGGRINKGALEICNGIDDDCDGLIDANDPSLTGVTLWYLDKDGDGYSTGDPVRLCSSPGPDYKNSGVIAYEDCDDGPNGGRINKGALEICNGIDDDCDGLIDANDPSLAGETLWYLDKDGDGYSTGTPIRSCTSPGANYKSSGVIAFEDCDDGPDGGRINKGAQEICNGRDDNCDGKIDEGFPDTDGNGRADACEQINTVKVTDCDLGTWQKVILPGGFVNFVKGPGTPPLGAGSVRLETVNSAAYAGVIRTGGTPITSFTYSSYLEPQVSPLWAPVVTFMVARDPSRSEVIFRPQTQGGVNPGTWQTWNAFEGLLENNLGTLSGYLSRNPGVNITGVIIRTATSNSFAYVDNVKVNGITYDFDVCDGDDDGISDSIDNCLSEKNPNQLDTDNDGIGNVCDEDDDNDGVNDADDCEPLNAALPTLWYLDKDGDGYSTGTPVRSCTSPGVFYKSFGVIAFEDCDDGPNGGRINKGAQEVCNGKDDDCDGKIDERLPDSDGNGIADACDYVSAIKVTDCDMNAWSKVVFPGGSVKFVRGPGAQTLGFGRLRLQSIPSAAVAGVMKSGSFTGVNSLTYSTYLETGAPLTWAPIVKFLLGGTNSENRSEVIFRPATQGGVVTGSWQKWNAWEGQLDNNLGTLSGFLSRNPDARVVGVLIQTATNESVGYVDNVKLGNVVYDFDLCDSDGDGILDATDNRINMPPSEWRNRALMQVETTLQGLALKAFPNPTNNNFTLKITGTANEKVEVKVFDVLGRVVFTASGNTNETYNFGANFVKGNYLLRVVQGDKKATAKLIKQ